MEKELKDGEELEMVEMRDEVMNFLIAVSSNPFVQSDGKRNENETRC